LVAAASAASLCLSGTADAAFPGDNGRIAFTRVSQNNAAVSDVYTVDPSGATEVRVTNSTQAKHPAWSPDGTRLAFADGLSIYTSDAFGANRSHVVTWTADIGAIDWSPDGTRLVASLQVCDTEDCNYDIYVMNLDGTGLTDLTPDLFDEGKPSWSPDGSKIAFDTLQAGNYDIYTVQPDGQNLTNVTATNSRKVRDPDWSPDGSRIAFSDVDTGHAYGVNADGGGEARLPAEIQPAWSPDGLQIVSTGVSFRTSYLDQSSYTDIPQAPNTVSREPDWQPTHGSPEPPPTGSGYLRPKAASPMRISLVPAYLPCPNFELTAPNREHGPPLAYESCSPPISWSQEQGDVTIGTPDSNGFPANAIGRIRLFAFPGNPSTPEDEADVLVEATQSDVRDTIHDPGSDYTGELAATFTLRVTDRFSAGGPDASATVEDFPLRVAIPCAATSNPGIGGQCDVTTSIDALVPGFVREGKRSVWGLDQVQVFDGGFDGDADTLSDNNLFEVQGIFVP
jgi:Tol biopolymer transport system component